MCVCVRVRARLFACVCAALFGCSETHGSLQIDREKKKESTKRREKRDGDDRKD